LGVWVLGPFFENYRRGTNFGATFFQGKSNEIILAKNGFGYIRGDFLML
jgi:hypothetical protein